MNRAKLRKEHDREKTERGRAGQGLSKTKRERLNRGPALEEEEKGSLRARDRGRE